MSSVRNPSSFSSLNWYLWGLLKATARPPIKWPCSQPIRSISEWPASWHHCSDGSTKFVIDPSLWWMSWSLFLKIEDLTYWTELCRREQYPLATRLLFAKLSWSNRWWTWPNKTQVYFLEYWNYWAALLKEIQRTCESLQFTSYRSWWFLKSSATSLASQCSSFS